MRVRYVKTRHKPDHKYITFSHHQVASCLAQWTTKFPQSRQQLRLDLVREELTRCAHMATVITFEHDLETLKPCALDLAERFEHFGILSLWLT